MLPPPAPPRSDDRTLLGDITAGLLDLLRSGGDSGGQAAARAVKNLSAGHNNTAKVGRVGCYGPLAACGRDAVHVAEGGLE